MTTTYGVHVMHSGSDDRLQDLRQAIAEKLEDLGLHRTVTIAVSESRPTQDMPRVAVYLGSSRAKMDKTIAADISSALDEGTVVLPIVSDLSSFNLEVPPSLAHVNGMSWTTRADLSSLVHIVLTELGIEERQRRVFLSHKREDGLGVAEQLHDRLSHHSFQPFIDRFAIRKGADVQAEIADALEDHAFLLLLETPLAHTSDWVFDEVDYALSHTMGILILCWPDQPSPVPGSQGIPRLELTSDDLVEDEHGYQILTNAGMDRVVEEIEASHALGLVRRRRMIVQSIEESAKAAGADSCVPLRDWRLLVHQAGKSIIVGTTPRLPTAEDLQAIEQVSVSAGTNQPALLVHSARRLPPRLKDHLQWVAGDRNLVVIPENAVGGWW